jgi:uncharacterized protein (DUF1501 family)
MSLRAGIDAMKKSARGREGVSRRDFLAVGGASLVGLSVAERLAEARRRGRNGDRSCVLILMNGGPSQLETFDPKPDAPREIRGPLRTIATAVPGVAFSESLPELARRADRLTVIRSLHHAAAPLHETGTQILQAGGLPQKRFRPTSVGAAYAEFHPSTEGLPAYALLGGGLQKTGASAAVGDASGRGDAPFPPLLIDEEGASRPIDGGAATAVMTDLAHEPAAMRDCYGDSRCGRLLLQARQLLEQGVGFVTVNTFNALEGARTWDAHGCPSSAPATLFDYQNWLGPQFDRAVAAFLDDLSDRGLLDSTLVVCCGEFGRTPVVNSSGGRDHWTECFSGLMFGGRVEPAVIGATSRSGTEITESPTNLSDLPARMRAFLKLPSVSG